MCVPFPREKPVFVFPSREISVSFPREKDERATKVNEHMITKGKGMLKEDPLDDKYKFIQLRQDEEFHTKSLLKRQENDFQDHDGLNEEPQFTENDTR